MSLTSYDLAGSDPSPMTRREVDVLKSLCANLPRDPIIIQIGAERGCSTMAMLEERPDAFIFSIDIGQRPEERANLTRGNLPWQQVVRGLGRSQQIGLCWPDRWDCDLLFIDGDHRRPGIDDDITAWIPSLRSGGILAFHDYIKPEDRGPQIVGRVFEAVNEWMEDHPPHIRLKWEQLLWIERLIAFRKP